MNFSKGKEMTSVILVFVACAILMFAAIYIYNNQESTAFHETQKKILEQAAEIKALDSLLTSNIGTVATLNTRVKSMEEKLVCYSGKIEKAERDVDHLQEHCAKLRESQIDIRNMLSSKRPVLKVTTPIPVDMVQRPEAPKPNPALINKIKKQLKGVSQ